MERLQPGWYHTKLRPTLQHILLGTLQVFRRRFKRKSLAITMHFVLFHRVDDELFKLFGRPKIFRVLISFRTKITGHEREMKANMIGKMSEYFLGTSVDVLLLQKATISRKTFSMGILSLTGGADLGCSWLVSDKSVIITKYNLVYFIFRACKC